MGEVARATGAAASGGEPPELGAATGEACRFVDAPCWLLVPVVRGAGDGPGLGEAA